MSRYNKEVNKNQHHIDDQSDQLNGNSNNSISNNNNNNNDTDNDDDDADDDNINNEKHKVRINFSMKACAMIFMIIFCFGIGVEAVYMAYREDVGKDLEDVNEVQISYQESILKNDGKSESVQDDTYTIIKNTSIQTEQIPNTNTTKNKLTYKRSQEQLLLILHKMMNPSNHPSLEQLQNLKKSSTAMTNKIKKSLHKQNQVYFAYSLSEQAQNQQFLQAEFYYYDKKYGIGREREELEICVVIVGRNLGDGYKRMIQSVLRQNYTNYRIVGVDDCSDDGTDLKIREYINIKENESLQGKIKYIYQNQRKYALYNRNFAIKQHCPDDSIIVDVDGDDWLIGKQVFKIVNALYQDSQLNSKSNSNEGKNQGSSLWACYFNNIIYSKECKCPLMNTDAVITQQMLQGNTYRTGKIWRTTQLRTFRKRLYTKIDQNDFIDSSSNNFYKWKSDAFINFALVELAGPKHIKFIDQFLYFYNTSFSRPSDQKSYCRLAAKIQTPYRSLQNLQEADVEEGLGKKMEGYRPPNQLVQEYQAYKKKVYGNK